MPHNLSPTNFARYPLLVLAVCFGGGVLLEYRIGLPDALTAIVLGGACLIAMLAPRIAVACLSIAFIALGALCLQLELSNLRPDGLRSLYDSGHVASGAEVIVEGVVSNGPEPTADGVVVTLEVSRIKYADVALSTSGTVRAYVLGSTVGDRDKLEMSDLGYGLILRVACPLRREQNFQNPGVLSQVELLDQQGIDAVCTVKDPASVEVIGQGNRTVLRPVFDGRRRLIDGFRRLLDPPTAGVMIASLLGDKYFVDRDTAEVFRDGGTFHILVISGLHITFIGGVVLLGVGFFTKRRVLRFLIAAVFLWAYTLAVGAEIPVVRASLMFTILLFSQIARREGSLLNALGSCALLLLVWRPLDLFTASFQLTFVSVAAIVGISLPLIEKLRAIGSWIPTSSTPFPPDVPTTLRRFCEMLYWHEDAWSVESKQNTWTARIFKSPLSDLLNKNSIRWFAAYLFEGLLVSAIVQLTLLPLSVYYFHRVSFVSIFLNLWVGVVLAVETFFAITAVLVSYFSGALAAPFAAAAELFNILLTSVPAALGDIISLSFRVSIYPGSMTVIYPAYCLATAAAAVILFRWAPFRLKRQRLSRVLIVSWVCICLLGMMIVLHPFSKLPPDGRLTIEFLDVGQGDSAFITYPDGQTMLIDGGGRFSYGRESDFVPDLPRIGERVVSEFLWEKGLSNIDYVLATHADADHMQGLADVVQNFSVGDVFVSRSEPNDPEFAELQHRIQRQAVRSGILGKGDALTIGGTTVEVLYPEFDDSPNRISDNNSSLVVKIDYGSRRILFAGDIEQASETALLDNAIDLQSDVIKVPHHGSKTSSTQAFVDAVRPSIAVISVGRRSTFGHPNAAVIERWKNTGSSVLTTGENGTITVSTDGYDLNVSTFLQKKER